MNKGWTGLARPEDTNWEEHSAVADLESGRKFKAVQPVPMVVKTDDSGGYFYFGFTKPGTATSSPYWRIMRSDGNDVVFAGGADTFVNIWDNRLTYSYS